MRVRASRRSFGSAGSAIMSAANCGTTGFIRPRMSCCARPEDPILDVGCGVGLLAFYLRERACRQPVLGLDVDARKIRYGGEIAADHYDDSRASPHDVAERLPVFSGNVALFDVLHYLPAAAQTALLFPSRRTVSRPAAC